jgi:AraC-like DNA-binding protein
LRVKLPSSKRVKELPLTIATTVLIAAGISHQIVDLRDSPMTLSVVCTRPRLLEEIPAFQPLWTSFKSCCGLLTPRQLSNPYSVGEFKRIFREIIVELGRDLPHREAATLARVTELLILLTRELRLGRSDATTKINADFEASLAYLEDHFTEPLQVDKLAEIAGMSYRAFTNRFKQRKGMTTSQYWNYLRIELTKRRLLETRDIFGSAIDAGFRDLSHFYKVFKRLVGETPNEFMSHSNGKLSEF